MIMNIVALSKRVAAGLAAAVILGVPLPASAVPPAMGIIGPIDIQNFLVADCGAYQVLAEWTVAAPYIEHYDQNGQLTHIEYFQQAGPVTFYNSAFPERMLVGKKGIEVARWDFVKGTIATMGQRFKLTVPGLGLVHIVAGQVTWDMSTDEIVFIAGQPGFIGGEVAALCAALAP
jgi:hypothetical protein